MGRIACYYMLLMILTCWVCHVDAWGFKIFRRRRTPPHAQPKPQQQPRAQAPAAPQIRQKHQPLGAMPPNVKHEMHELWNHGRPPLVWKDVWPEWPWPYVEQLQQIVQGPVLWVWGKSKAILLFKPPVGAVAVYLVRRLISIRRQRSKGLAAALLTGDEAALEGGTLRNKKKKRRRGRALDLDVVDRDYERQGGIESVRVELALAALEKWNVVDENANDKNTNDTTTFPSAPSSVEANQRLIYANAAREVLLVSCPPRGSREVFVEQCVLPLATCQSLYRGAPPPATLVVDNNNNEKDPNNFILPNDGLLLWKAAKVGEVRAMDAMLRVLRDRLVVSATRLKRTSRHIGKQVTLYDRGGHTTRFLHKWLVAHLYRRGATLAKDRRRLAIAEAAYRMEIDKLGRVQQMLLTRPPELSGTALIAATSSSSDDTVVSSTKTPPGDGSIHLSSEGAARVFMSEDKNQWGTDAHRWTRDSRTLIRQVIDETMAGLDPTEKLSSVRNTTVAQDLMSLEEWSNEEGSATGGWRAVLSLVDGLSEARRLGERRLFRDVAYRWTTRLDFYGVPSSITTLAVAYMVHNTVKPHWPKIVDFGGGVYQAIKGIVIFRFWRPLKDIVLDLLNRRPHLLDPYALADAQVSLDNMLKDLGIGDGRPASRNEALAAAARMYEQELSSGAVKNLVRGRMVRLMLIQIQQLKAGLLMAMGSIDELVDANRLNVQLLAAIPAFILVYVVSRVFFVALYSLSSGDLRPTGDVLAEMSDYLVQMERTLLLAGHNQDVHLGVSEPSSQKEDNTDENVPGETRNEEPAALSSWVFLEKEELGEFVLTLHSYLLLLDFVGTPFTKKTCNTIHEGLQDLLMQGQLRTSRQIPLLKLIQSKHVALEKALK